MANPYGNYQSNQGLLSGPGLNPQGIDPELLRQITGILSAPPPAIGLGFPAGYEGAKGPMAAERLGQYAVEGGGLSQDDVIAHSLAASSMMMGGGMPMAEAGAVGVAGGRLPANYRDAFNLGPRNEYLGGLPATPEAIQARAAQQGYNPNQTLYHGRTGEFEGMGFKDPSNNYEKAIFLASDPAVANAYAHAYEGPSPLSPNANEVMPLVARYKNPKEVDLGGKDYFDVKLSPILEAAKNEGHDAVWLRNLKDISESGTRLQDQLAIFDPAAIRSKFAAFNPKYAGTSNLISTRGVPFGLLSDRNQP
jgi:hypothetical protein